MAGMAATDRSGTSLSTAAARQTLPGPSRFSMRSTSAAMPASGRSPSTSPAAWRNACVSASGTRSCIASTPRPGSTVSSRSLSRRARWAAWRDGAAVPMRIACTEPSTRSNSRSRRRAPCPAASSSPQTAVQQLVDDRAEGLGGQQRLDEREPVRHHVVGHHGLDRLEHAPGRLVEPQRDLLAEAAHQRSPGGFGQLADPVEAQPPQRADGLRRQAQGGDRQRRDRRLVGAGGDDGSRIGPRSGPRRARRRACRRPRRGHASRRGRAAPAGPPAAPPRRHAGGRSR